MDDTAQTLRMTRTFPASPERVFNAWIDPAMIRRWMSGDGYVVTEVEVDARVGGPYRIVVEGPDGAHITTGEFRALDTGKRLEMTWCYEGPHTEFADAETILTVHFKPIAENATEIILIHSKLATDSIKKGYEEGWASCMSGMHAIFDPADGERVDEVAVRFERILPGPIDRVWNYMTSAEHLGKWIGEGYIEPKPGGAVDIENGHIRGIVTQWKPPHRLAFTWNVFAPSETESGFPESYVTFELAEAGPGVRLTLTHRPMLKEYEALTLMGWHTILDRFGALVRGEEPEPRETLAERNRIRYGITKERLAEVMAAKEGK